MSVCFPALKVLKPYFLALKHVVQGVLFIPLTFWYGVLAGSSEVASNASYEGSSGIPMDKALRESSDDSMAVNENNVSKATGHSSERNASLQLQNKKIILLHELKDVEKSINKVPRYTCSICRKTFTRWCHLKSHEKIHGEEPFVCSVCNKTFTQSLFLKEHTRFHCSERRYVCSVCNKAFKASSALKYHENVHSGKRPYACSVCKKTFINLSSLIKHERIHSGERPSSCSVC